uniref:Uncharacterized protein n=1 Tax=Timema bartmani TaxID=61472 RepID=A0A7R9F8T0_9NEOP|nr:unnamed protein product [Timema bartmani]
MVMMAEVPYKLSCVLYGHKSDVRAVAATRNGCIVSGSRDKSAKLWTPNSTVNKATEQYLPYITTQTQQEINTSSRIGTHSTNARELSRVRTRPARVRHNSTNITTPRRREAFF